MPNYHIHVVILYPSNNSERILALSGANDENISLLEQQLDISLGGNGFDLKILFPNQFKKDFYQNKHFTTSYQEHSKYVENIIRNLYEKTIDAKGKVHYLGYQEIMSEIHRAKNLQEIKFTSSKEEAKKEVMVSNSKPNVPRTTENYPQSPFKQVKDAPTAADAAALHAKERAARLRVETADAEALALARAAAAVAAAGPQTVAASERHKFNFNLNKENKVDLTAVPQVKKAEAKKDEEIIKLKEADKELAKDLATFTKTKKVSLFPNIKVDKNHNPNPGFSLDKESSILGEDLFEPQAGKDKFTSPDFSEIDLTAGLELNHTSSTEASPVTNKQLNIKDNPSQYIAQMSDEDLDGNPEEELAKAFFDDHLDIIDRIELTVQDFASEGKGYGFIKDALGRMYREDQVKTFEDYQRTVVEMRDLLNLERDKREEAKEEELKAQKAIEEALSFWSQNKTTNAPSLTPQEKIAKAREIATKAKGKTIAQQLGELAEGGGSCGSGCGCGGHDHGRPVLNYPKPKKEEKLLQILEPSVATTSSTPTSVTEESSTVAAVTSTEQSQVLEELNNSVLVFDRNREVAHEASKVYGEELSVDELLTAIESPLDDLTVVKGIPLTAKGKRSYKVVSGIVDTEVKEKEVPNADTPLTKPTTKAQLAQKEKFMNHSGSFSSIGRGKIKPQTINQQLYIDNINEHDITFGLGPAGSGKSFLAVAMAVDALLENRCRRIILTRPAVEAGEKLGFLPGDIAQKLDPYLKPLYDAMVDILSADKVTTLLEKGIVEIAPLAFMRGRTLSDAFIILDEAQNTTPEQMKMFLTRLGFNSKMVVTGDTSQIDLPNKVKSGIIHVQEVLQNIPGVAFSYLYANDVVRHHTVTNVVKAYEYFEATHANADKKVEAKSLQQIQAEVLSSLATEEN